MGEAKQREEQRQKDIFLLRLREENENLFFDGTPSADHFFNASTKKPPSAGIHMDCLVLFGRGRSASTHIIKSRERSHKHHELCFIIPACGCDSPSAAANHKIHVGKCQSVGRQRY